MILTLKALDAIRRSEVTCAFRRWRRPSVRTGGTLLTAVGQLEIRAVVPVTAREISEADATRAGHPSRQALLAVLDERADGEVYRVDFGVLRPDPRIALRESTTLTPAEGDVLRARLRRLDVRAADGPWTLRTLEAIRDHPGRRAADLCRTVGQDRLPFKTNVRKLKALGLTESLDVGYRLSPRGAALLGSGKDR